MRKFVVFMFIALFSVATYATEGNPVKKEIRTHIVKLLGNYTHKVPNNIKTSVEFIVNRSGEIVILNVDCTSTEICDYLKSKLNYKKVSPKNIDKRLQVYKMPLTIVKG